MHALVFAERIIRPGAIRSRSEVLAAQEPLVIMGRGKSGTRLLAWACQELGFALGATDRLKTGDLDDRRFLRVVKWIARRNLSDPDSYPNSAAGPRRFDVMCFQREAHRVWQRLSNSPEARLGWGWKWPETYLILPYVHVTFPRARFLHLVRDGRDLAFKRHLTDDPRRALGKALLTRLEARGQPHHLQAARSWQFQVEQYRTYAERIPPGQRMETTYEALCGDPEGEMARIADFLQVPYSEACRNYVNTHFNKSLIGAWRAEDSARVAEVEAVIGDTLTALGYALSTHPVAESTRRAPDGNL
ncbi:MAG: sulfotransferase [Nanoarchaeota archaeon]|nr:sulfotransferase [Nanoarchaeota archaeon]